MKTTLSLVLLFAAGLTAGCNWSTSTMRTDRRTGAAEAAAPADPVVSVPGTVTDSEDPSEAPLPPIAVPVPPATPPPVTTPLPTATPPPPARTPLWPVDAGTPSDDRSEAVLADAAGNVYVAGWTEGSWMAATSAGSIDGFLVKYDAEGGELWRRQFGGSGKDFALGLTMDAQGDLYVAGQTTDDIDGEAFQGGGKDLFVRKYRSDGSLVWNRLIGTTDTEELFAVAHWKESLYLAGRSSRDIALWRINQTDGSFDPSLDFRDFDGSPALDRVRDIAADPDGHLYVCGETSGDFPKVLNGLAHQRFGLPESYPNRGGTDGFVMHLNFDMGLIDTFTVGSPQDDVISGVAAPDTSGVLIAGATMSADLFDPANPQAASDSNRFVASLARTGSRYGSRWSVQSGFRAPESALKLRVDAFGDVWVLGSEGGSADAGFFVTKYEGATGNAVFDLSLGTPLYEEPAAIALDASGDAFVTGLTRKATGNDDIFIVGIGGSGDFL